MPSFLTKLNLDKYNKKHFGILFIVGLLLVVIAMPTSEKEETIDAYSSDEAQVITEYSSAELDYKATLEQELEEILALVDGVGEVEVMITLETTTQKVVEKDISTSADEEEEVTVYTNGVNGEEPYIYVEIYPTIEGVLVAASGGDNSIVVQDIKEAIQALFQVESHKIKIMKMISSE